MYETKTSRVLATGEIREYTIKQHYVVKKKQGICKTELKRQEAKLHTEIAIYIRPFEISYPKEVLELCKRMNVTYSDEYSAAYPNTAHNGIYGTAP